MPDSESFHFVSHNGLPQFARSLNSEFIQTSQLERVEFNLDQVGGSRQDRWTPKINWIIQFGAIVYSESELTILFAIDLLSLPQLCWELTFERCSLIKRICARDGWIGWIGSSRFLKVISKICFCMTLSVILMDSSSFNLYKREFQAIYTYTLKILIRRWNGTRNWKMLLVFVEDVRHRLGPGGINQD